MTPKGRDKVTIKIPRELYQKLGALIEGKGFGSVTEYIVHVLRNQSDSVAGATPEGLTPRETALVRSHLRSLGYLE